MFYIKITVNRAHCQEHNFEQTVSVPHSFLALLGEGLGACAYAQHYATIARCSIFYIRVYSIPRTSNIYSMNLNILVL